MPQAISTSADSRAAVKAKIQELNRLAQEADAQMRTALQARNQQNADLWRQRRDNYNAESRKLSDWLNNPTTPAPDTGGNAAAGLTADEEKRLAKLPYDIKFAEQQLAKGDTRYQAILQDLKAEQAELLRKQAAASQPATPAMTPDELKKRLNELPYKIQYAEKMLAEYRRQNNAQKINEWAQELQNLEAEYARLSKLAGSTGSTGNTGSSGGAGSSGGNTASRPVTPTPVTPAPATPPATSSGDFVTTVADRFNLNNDQDYAHNAILEALLKDKYSAANIPASDSNAPAYNVVRQNNSAPLHWIRNQQQAQTLFTGLPLAGDVEKRRFPRLNLSGKKAGKNFFIRDFMQVYSKGGLTVGDLVAVDDTVYSPFARDFDRLVGSINEYQRQKGRTYRVLPFLGIAHRDAIQLIPEPTAEGINQFGGAVMSDVSIAGNVIFSDGALQGIFASDGAFRNLHIRNNHLQIGGQHTITISGLLSGSILGNTDINNNPLADDKIALYPLRLGGGANIYVLGFSNKASVRPGDARYYQYEDILGVPSTRDFRRQFSSGNAQCYRGVDMIELHALLQRQKPQTPAQWKEVMAELVRKGFAQQVS